MSHTLQKYEQWKEVLPDMSWLDNVFPNEQKWKDIRESLMMVKNIFPDNIEIGKYNNVAKGHICMWTRMRDKHEIKVMKTWTNTNRSTYKATRGN